MKQDKERLKLKSKSLSINISNLPDGSKTTRASWTTSTAAVVEILDDCSRFKMISYMKAEQLRQAAHGELLLQAFLPDGGL